MAIETVPGALSPVIAIALVGGLGVGSNALVLHHFLSPPWRERNITVGADAAGGGHHRPGAGRI